MTGREKTGPALDSPSVLVARDLSPADTLNLDTGNLKALVLREGSPNGHTAILAQLLGIPAVIGAGEALDAAEEGMTCLVDGASGTVILEPDEAALGEFRSKYSAGEAEQAALARYRDIPAVTPRGRRIRVYCNIGSPEEAQAALACGCEGIGLFRTEFLYLRGGSYPSEEAQCEAYRSVLEAMGDKPVIVRTCDIGSDKTAPYLQLPEEENPALGIRGIRLCLRRRDMFLCQLRALLRASVYGRLSVMFPMVSSLSELLEARALWREAEKQLEQEGVPFRSRVPLGVMIETPAAALMADTLAEEADFFSIGTNDLTQYTLAADRQSGDAADIFDPSHPAVKKLIAMTCAAAKSRGKLAGICGNSAGDASLLEFYEEAGVGELSVSPGRCLSLKRDICEL